MPPAEDLDTFLRFCVERCDLGEDRGEDILDTAVLYGLPVFGVTDLPRKEKEVRALGRTRTKERT
jgi:hypothetical protein